MGGHLETLIPVLALCAPASLLAISCLRQLAQARGYPSWPSASARVTVSEVRAEERRRARRRARVHAAVVRYDCVVEGVHYEAGGIAIGYAPARSRRPAEEVVARYPLGASLPVRYRPGHPDEACLEAPRVTGARIGVLVAAGILAVACFVWRMPAS